MFLVPLDELAWQARDAFREANPNLVVEVEKAEHRAAPDADVIIGSVQSLGREDSPRLRKFDPRSVRRIVIDECHGSTSKSYRNILTYFNAMKGEPGCDNTKLVAGISATITRADGVGLESIFDKISYRIDIRELMETGVEIKGGLYTYLSRPKVHRISTEVDISQVRTSKGDYVEKELAAALDTPDRNRLIVKKYLELGEGLPAICFTVDVAHAHHIVEVFTEFGVSAAVIHGGMKREERLPYYDAYRSGHLKVLASCAALATGFDMPQACVGLMARTTSSALLYTQQCGRLFRPFPSPEGYAAMLDEGRHPEWVKPYSILMDFSDLTSKHPDALCSVPSLFGLAADFDMKGEDALKVVAEVEAIAAKNPRLDLKAAKSIADLKHQVDTIDIFQPPTVRPEVRKLSRFSWMELFAGVLQVQIGRGALEIRENTIGQFEVWRSLAGVRALVETKASLKDALVAADGMVPRDQEVLLSAKARWKKDPPTEPQCCKLWKVDPLVKARFRSGGAFYQHAKGLFEVGHAQYSKGSISAMIDRVELEGRAGR